jgi:hypothetical protein
MEQVVNDRKFWNYLVHKTDTHVECSGRRIRIRRRRRMRRRRRRITRRRRRRRIVLCCGTLCL